MRKFVLALVAGSAAIGLAGVAIAQQAEETAAPAAAPAAAAPVVATPMDIYRNELGAGWHNRSSAQVELGVDVGSSRKPIRVEAGPWQSLHLHHEPFSTAPYRAVDLLIQSTPPGGQPVRIIALADGKPLSETGKVVTLKPGGWTHVVVPLANLNAANVTIDGIWVQNGTDQPLPPFYVSDIVLK